eukprot:1237326-Alexandrium_andersonii.AAC.1
MAVACPSVCPDPAPLERQLGSSRDALAERRCQADASCCKHGGAQCKFNVAWYVWFEAWLRPLAYRPDRTQLQLSL